MGIDIYAAWNGQTDAERADQITGMSAAAGRVGYLREAYHGGPYVTHYFVPEAFDAPFESGAPIPSGTLRARLPVAVLLHLYREQKLYSGGEDPSRVEFDALAAALKNTFAAMDDHSHEAMAKALSPESIAHAERLIADRVLPDTALAFVDFAELCERKERQFLVPCLIAASY